MNDSSQTTSGTNAFQILAPLIIAVIVAGISYFVFGYPGKSSNFEELALGDNTRAYYAKYDGIPVHCSDLRDAQQCLDGFQLRHGKKAVLWLGNSQLHAINQYQDGEQNASSILFQKLKTRDYDLLTFSQPNANLQEHLVLFTYLQQKLPIRFLILPIVFDDMREDGIRPTIVPALRHSSAALEIGKTDIGKRILAKNVSSSSDENIDTAGLTNTIQDHSERFLNSLLSSNITAWSDRSEMRGSIFVSLYRLRNYLFGIKATSKRRLIKAQYDENMLALQSILKYASQYNIKTLLYVVPLRNDVEPPYDILEYENFKRDLKQLAVTENAHLVNLENVVPPEYWGKKDSTTLNDTAELDFMHFQGRGHVLLANELNQVVGNIIRGAGR